MITSPTKHKVLLQIYSTLSYTQYFSTHTSGGYCNWPGGGSGVKQAGEMFSCEMVSFSSRGWFCVVLFIYSSMQLLLRMETLKVVLCQLVHVSHFMFL